MGKGKIGCATPVSEATRLPVPGSRPGEVFYATPGVMDSDAQAAFSFGHCHSLALAVHNKTGLPMLAMSRHSRTGELTHVVIELPDGRWLDSRGVKEADGEEVMPLSREQALELGERPDWLSADPELAESFVEPLLEWARTEFGAKV